jgi:hypothetical protein
MDDAERAELLRSVNRQTATVGASIPETITIHGEEARASTVADYKRWLGFVDSVQ